jgi:phosphoribosylglycinamide formyltransferase-1
LLNIAVFASGRGSNFEALYHALKKDNSPARIVMVLSNNSQSGALALARSFNIPAFHISQRQFTSSETFNEKIVELLRLHAVNFVVLAGYMKKIDVSIVRAFHNRIINIHPALLPKFGGEGMFGMHVHEAVIAAGEKFSGATVHYIDEEYDRGDVIDQETVSIDEHETAETLAAKVLRAEHVLLPRVVKKFAAASE